ncbi:MAG: DUF2075 domain-containing protein, partial [Bacteroidales bacterium]|nr:DUF2075 domain-containing protein [Bacteroidales bacterium]
IVDDPDIDDEIQICIEYNIPLTSKRVDFIIAGADQNHNENIIIVELKQWQKAEVVADDMHYCVKTFVANTDRIVCHPSYQAYSYSCFLKNYSQSITDETINLVPCAYLHNYQPEYRQTLSDPIYKEWYDIAPFFIKNETDSFSNFIKKYITKKSSKGDLLYLIDHGRLKPTKALQDSLVSMVKGNKEFMLLDEQAVCFDMCLKTMTQCLKDKKKRTIIIQGGPGTGKSVLAVNLLMEYIKQSLNASYVTKNSAPRQAFLKLLTNSDARRLINIAQLFRSPFGLSNSENNTYDCLIVDEAHRLVKKMYGDWGGVNQIMECINASLLSIFLLDEDQAVTTKDIGSIKEIQYWCKELGSKLIIKEETKLISQFRCNGSDAYIQFIDAILQRTPETVEVNLSELNFDFKVFDCPNTMREALRAKNQINNKSRMVAGYCYDWNVKHHRGKWDIVIGDNFTARWNLENDRVWAINPDSFEEVGCIHTAQGLEFDYVGVIIGKDLMFNPITSLIETHREYISKDDKSSGIRTAPQSRAHQLILNTYKTLLTRGQKGCYVYCEDNELRDYIKSKCN